MLDADRIISVTVGSRPDKSVDMRYVELVPLNDEQCEAFIVDDLADYAAQLMRDEGLDRAAAAAKAHEFEPTLRRQHADASSLGASTLYGG